MGIKAGRDQDKLWLMFHQRWQSGGLVLFNRMGTVRAGCQRNVEHGLMRATIRRSPRTRPERHLLGCDNQCARVVQQSPRCQRRKSPSADHVRHDAPAGASQQRRCRPCRPKQGQLPQPRHRPRAKWPLVIQGTKTFRHLGPDQCRQSHLPGFRRVSRRYRRMDDTARWTHRRPSVPLIW
jgi:hypothetical protein